MSRRRSKVGNQKGFTLIEIIAVLVILGILAAVAIPRFMDLTDVAANKAAMQAVAEGKSRLSNQFARGLLETSTPPTTAAVVAAVNTDAGDYRLTFDGTAASFIRITVNGKGSVKGTATGVWLRPQ